MTRGLRILALAVLAAAAAVLAFPTLLAIRGAGRAVFEPERLDFALMAAAAFGIAIGAQVVPWVRSTRIAVLAMLASAALLFACVAAFSIGIAILPIGLVLLVVLYRALRRGRTPAGAAPALGGAAIGYSGVLLFLALLVPATVECSPNSVATSSRRWAGSAQQQLMSTGRGGPQPGVYTGYSEYADSVVTFRCEAGRLIEFQRTAR